MNDMIRIHEERLIRKENKRFATVIIIGMVIDSLLLNMVTGNLEIW